MKTVGTLYLDERRADKVLSAQKPAVADSAREICSQQMELRGHEKPFRFKALGFNWRYVPEGS